MTPFIGQLALFAFNLVPKGWTTAAGQILPINQNQALFALLGTTYGGDGIRTFGLPDLRGRVAVGSGTNYVLGQPGGEEYHTLTINEVPFHQHSIQADAATASANQPNNNLLGKPSTSIYSSNASFNGTLANLSIANAGGSQPHENRSPFLAMQWCIALVGIFPSRN